MFSLDKWNHVRDVHDLNADRLMERDDIVGVGITVSNGEPCLRVYCYDERHDPIPSDIDGVPVVIEVTGEIVAG